jgi:hypothetical protein
MADLRPHSPTEDGLKKFLQPLELWTVAPKRSGLGAHLPVTGRCDPATLAAFSEALDRH